MDGSVLLIFLIAIGLFIFVVGGAAMGFRNGSRLKALQNEVTKLIAIVDNQKKQLAQLHKTLSDTSRSNNVEPYSNDQHGTQNDHTDAKPVDTSNTGTRLKSTDDQKVVLSTPDTVAASVNVPTASSKNHRPATPKKTHNANKTKTSFNLETFLMGNGLLWIGAVILSFGGVFLAKYSIEAGLFPPHLRIISGAIFGVLLIAVADYLYRHPARFNINTPFISAALASGGVITCFAMTYVAFDFYAFITPLVAFAILACIATAAAWLSLRFGPLLAVIGIIGAYLVPALVSTGSNNILALLIYVALVSLSSTLVVASVKKSWLWYLTAAGHFLWMFIAIVLGDASHAVVILCFALISIYLFVLVPILGWRLAQTVRVAFSLKALIIPRKEQLGIILPAIAIGLFFLIHMFWNSENVNTMLWILTIFSVVLCIAPIKHSAFDTWPFIALALVLFTYLNLPIEYDYSDNLFVFSGHYLVTQVAFFSFALYAFYVHIVLRKASVERPAFLLLLALAPLLVMGISYTFSPAEAAQYLYAVYATELLITALTFTYLGVKEKSPMTAVTYWLLVNGAITLTCTMLLSANTLTLALATQILLMTYLGLKFNVALPAWLFKLASIAILIRLTASPWLEQYAEETLFTLHWSIVVYPLVLGILWLARRLQQSPSIKNWLGGAMLHVLALMVTTETSYLLMGQYPQFGDMSFKQSVLMAMNWLILSAVYLWRSQYSSMKRLYQVFAAILITGVATIHIDISFINNPFMTIQETGSNIVFNWLLPLWLVPAALLFSLTKSQVLKNLSRGAQLTKLFTIIAAVFTVFYVNGLIRTSFNPYLRIDFNAFDSAELYTYSIVWLFAAIGLIVWAKKFLNEKLNRIGFSILAIVVLKAFVVDMAHLEGILRAASFIGLGLSLVALGWLFQRFRQNHDKEAKC